MVPYGVIWWTDINISGENTVSIFRVKVIKVERTAGYIVTMVRLFTVGGARFVGGGGMGDGIRWTNVIRSP
jgi:hypothetical protein